MNAWSPRALARSAPPETACYWLTASAVDRVESAIAHGTLDYSDVPPMVDNVIIGLAKPLRQRVVADGDRSAHYSFPVNTLIVLPRDPVLFRGMHLLSIGHGGWGTDATGALYCVRRNDFRGLIHTSHYAEKIAAILRDDERVPLVACGDGAEYAAQFLRAAWLLLNSEVEREVSATELDQAVPRVRTASNHRRPDDVAVLDVRKPAPVRRAGGCGRVVEHDHRWTRRGHWRMQPYGAGNAQRRRIWIEPQVCGPVDKPLLVRPKVSVLR